MHKLSKFIMSCDIEKLTVSKQRKVQDGTHSLSNSTKL